MIKFSPRVARTIFCFILLLTEFCSASERPGEIDLRAFDWAEPKKVPNSSYTGPAVSFLDDQTVAVSFYANNPSPGLSKREDPRGGVFLFETSLFDVESGKSLSSHIWGNASPWSAVFALLDGNMLLKNQKEIAIYSRDYKRLATYSFPANSFASVKVSSDGRYVYLRGRRERFDKHRNDLKMLASATLEEIRTFELPPHFSEIAYDSFVAYDVDNNIFVKRDALPEKRVVFDSTFAPQCGRTRLEFLTLQKHLVLDCEDLLLTDLDGRVLAQMKHHGRVIGGLTQSRNGSLLAASTFQLKGGSSWLDTFPNPANFRIVVLESATLKEVFTLPIKTDKREFPHYALSPDGSKLAYVEAGIVKIVELSGNPVAK